jgi:CBS domain-containing protein
MRKKPPAKVDDVLKIKGPGTTTIKPSETIAMLARRLQQERLGAMIVSNDGRTVEGIISERDVAYGVALHKGDLHALPVAALMTKNAVTCTPQDSVAEVSRVMAERHIRHLPVVEGDQLVGVIAMRDIFMHRLDEMQRMTKLLGSYVGAGQ